MNNVATGSIVTKQFADQPENYVFRNSANDSIQAPMIVEEAIVRRGFKKVAILADSTNYGQLGRADLEKALEAKGIKPVAVEKFNIKDVDMTAQLLQGQGSRRRGRCSPTASAPSWRRSPTAWPSWAGRCR